MEDGTCASRIANSQWQMADQNAQRFSHFTHHISRITYMSTNLNTQLTSSRSLSSEGWAAIAGAVGSAFLLAKKLLAGRPPKTELMTRADFYTEMLGVREALNRNHVALLEKLDSNHREILAALERQGARISILEAGFARLDERTRDS
jgi:hypothetical protein